MAASAWRYRQYVKALNAGRNPPAPGTAFGLALTGVLVLAGIVLAAYLLKYE
jgi:hypothetical protein